MSVRLGLPDGDAASPVPQGGECTFAPAAGVPDVRRSSRDLCVAFRCVGPVAVNSPQGCCGGHRSQQVAREDRNVRGPAARRLCGSRQVRGASGVIGPGHARGTAGGQPSAPSRWSTASRPRSRRRAIGDIRRRFAPVLRRDRRGLRRLPGALKRYPVRFRRFRMGVAVIRQPAKQEAGHGGPVRHAGGADLRSGVPDGVKSDGFGQGRSCRPDGGEGGHPPRASIAGPPLPSRRVGNVRRRKVGAKSPECAHPGAAADYGAIQSRQGALDGRERPREIISQGKPNANRVGVDHASFSRIRCTTAAATEAAMIAPSAAAAGARNGRGGSVRVPHS